VALTPERSGHVGSGRVLGLAGIISLFVAWQLAMLLGIISPARLPSPSDVLLTMGRLLTSPLFLADVADTLTAWAVTMGLGSLIAIPTGVLVGYIAALYRPASAVIHAARSVTAAALLPVAILLFGLGTPMKVTLAVWAITWPLLLNSMYGTHAVDGRWITTGRSLHWGRWKILARIILPAAAPSIATGLRLAASIALIVILTAEILGARSGVGTVIDKAQIDEQPAIVYAGIIVIGLLGMVITFAMSAFERRLMPWPHANRLTR